MGFSLLDVGGLVLGMDIPEEPQGVRLLATFLVLTGERQRLLGEGLRLFQVAGQHLRLTQREATERLNVYTFHRNALLQRRREQQHSVSDAPAQRIRRAQVRTDLGEKGRKVCILADAHGPFEQGQCPRQIALAESQQADLPTGKH